MNFPNSGQTNRHLNYPFVAHPHVADEGHTPFSRTIVIDTDKPISSNNLGRKGKKENMVPVPTNDGIYVAADTHTLFEKNSTTILVDGSHHSRSVNNQAEEIALCNAWCDVLESRTTTLNFKGFWSEFLACFENEIGEKIRRYDAVALK
ncbi:hypothetical protein Tco_0950378 [Tanacetum coccineum]